MRDGRIGVGLFAGVVGGVVFVLTMGMMRILPPAGDLIGRPTALATGLLDVLGCAILGVLFAALCGRLPRGAGRGVGFGLIYGAGWWALGPLTLLPLLLGEGHGPPWSGDALMALLPALIGYATFGAVLGATYGWLLMAIADRSATRPGGRRHR